MISSDSGKTIGITGGNGYLGANLAKRLIGRNKVVILDLQNEGAVPGVEYRQCDLRSLDACIESLVGIDVVFHRAGLYGNLSSMSQPGLYYATNLTATNNVLEACLKTGVSRLIFDSTAFVYGPSVISPVNEKAIALPASIYGATKLAAEKLVGFYDRAHGLSSIILRFSRVRDALRSDVITSLARAIHHQRPIQLFENGSPALDFVHIEDVLDASVRAGISGHRNEILNISCGSMKSLLEIAATLAARLRRPMPKIESRQPRHRPPDTEYLFGPTQFSLDIEKAKRLLEWSPKWTLDAMIYETADTVMANGNA